MRSGGGKETGKKDRAYECWGGRSEEALGFLRREAGGEGGRISDPKNTADGGGGREYCDEAMVYHYKRGLPPQGMD